MTWVYLSGQYYAMHDVCKDAVKFDEYALVKIMGYLDDNLNTLMPQLPVWTYQFGVFFGNNIAFVSSPTSAMPFSDEVYKGIRKKRNFAIGLATGIGEVFTSLDEKTQEVVLNLSQTEVEFSKGLGTALGNKFAFLDDAHKNLILEKVGRNIILSRFLGYGIGCNFSKIERKSRMKLLSESGRFAEFADGLGYGIGYTFTHQSKELQDGLWRGMKSIVSLPAELVLVLDTILPLYMK